MNPLLAVTHTARSGARTGIQAVVRGLLAGGGFEPVAWFPRGRYFHLLNPAWVPNEGGVAPAALRIAALVRVPSAWSAWLRAFGQVHRMPVDRLPTHRRLAGGWLVVPELVDASNLAAMLGWARRRGLRVAVVFHDAIPWLRPDLTERTAGRMPGIWKGWRMPIW